jgi:hypothetical protein
MEALLSWIAPCRSSSGGPIAVPAGCDSPAAPGRFLDMPGWGSSTIVMILKRHEQIATGEQGKDVEAVTTP